MRTLPLGFLLTCSLSAPLYGITCTANVAVPTQARANGRAEALGDLVLLCTPPPSVTSANITISLNAPVSSRAFTAAPPQNTEALLLINDPGAPFLIGTPPTQIPCTHADVLAQTCAADANVFPGFLTAPNAITFYQVPIPTSTVIGGQVLLRVTNLRVDIPGMGQPVATSPGYPPLPMVEASISISGPISIPLTYPNQPMAYIQPGETLNVSVMQPDLSGLLPPGGLPLSQCVPVNRPLALDAASTSVPDGVSFVVRVREQDSFLGEFKNLSIFSVPVPDVNFRPAAEPQNVPGTIYDRETNFYNPAFPAAGGLSTAGLATQATRIMVRFNGPAGGVQVHAPIYERGRGPADSRVRLVASGPDGGSLSYVPLGPLSPLNTYYSTAQLYVYEFTAKAPQSYEIDTIDLPFFLAHTGMPYVSTGLTTVNVTLAPISSDGSPFATYIPRFADMSFPVPVADLAACAGTPAVKALISSRSGPSTARVWNLGINNYGTAPATNAKITSLTLTQTFGPACTPVIGTPFPAAIGTVPAGSTVTAPVTISFAGCTATSRYTVAIGYAADGGISGTSTYFNQFQ